jgi:2-oxoglutarate/2-oxoacid ferredoxin oxidoreductase subunit beta
MTISSERDNSTETVELPQLTRKDFVSDQEVRWCPGCGDYGILAQTQKVLPDLGIPRENFVFISGIGCSSRFPYYMNTYGFHSIHGRAPTLATGVKVANPDLSVWVITGDGDGLSIGGNHLIHAIRRNIDLNIILFNNRIYGLTKGQYSPTSEFGKRTKSSPLGSLDQPINPLRIAIASEATFVARSIDVDTKHLAATLERAARHKGVSFVEVYQNCNVFNDGAYIDFTEKSVRPNRVLYLEDGQPMIYGKNRDRGLRINKETMLLESVVVGVDGVTEDDLATHDIAAESPMKSYLLTELNYPQPVPVGVFREVDRPTYEDLVHDQVAEAKKKVGVGNLESLLNAGETWDIA